MLLNDERFVTRALLLLVRHWLWVLTAALVSAAGASWLVMQEPRVYHASVAVVPKRARTEVVYDTRIRTLSSDNAGSSGSALAGTSPERRTALANLVRNADIEAAVRQDLGDKLPPSLRQKGALLTMVSGLAMPRDELITIGVDADTPQLAEDVAVAWGKAYERHVNRLYVTESISVEQMDQELNAARQKYTSAESALNSLLASSPLVEYSMQLEQKQQALRDRQSLQPQLSKVAQRVELLLNDAQALQQQLNAARDNSSAASTAAALAVLKMQAFTEPVYWFSSSGATISTSTGGAAGQSGGNGSSTDSQVTVNSNPAGPSQSLPGGLQLQLSPGQPVPTLDQQRADVAATIQALQEWRARLQDTLSQPLSLTATDGAAVPATQAAQEIRDLQAKIAEVTARERNMRQERDVAWDSYTSLLKKAEEARVTRAIGTGNEVALANSAVVASLRPRRSLITIPITAAIVGAVLASMWIVLVFSLPAIYRQSLDVALEQVRAGTLLRRPVAERGGA